MALPIQTPAELRFSSRLGRHALSTLKALYKARRMCLNPRSRDANVAIHVSKCAFMSQSALVRLMSALESAYKAHTKCVQIALSFNSASQSTLVGSKKTRFADRKCSSSGKYCCATIGEFSMNVTETGGEQEKQLTSMNIRAGGGRRARLQAGRLVNLVGAVTASTVNDFEVGLQQKKCFKGALSAALLVRFLCAFRTLLYKCVESALENAGKGADVQQEQRFERAFF
eukprot:1160620-Pelagomonas_calceolata.AAC.5